MEINSEYLNSLSLFELKELYDFYSNVFDYGSVEGGRPVPTVIGDDGYERYKMIEKAYWNKIIEMDTKLFGTPIAEFGKEQQEKKLSHYL